MIIEDGLNAAMYAWLFAMALLAFAWQDPRTMEAHFDLLGRGQSDLRAEVRDQWLDLSGVNWATMSRQTMALT